jgi:hypothetical protein
MGSVIWHEQQVTVTNFNLILWIKPVLENLLLGMDMPLFKTRHSKKFNPLHGSLNRNLSPYAQSYDEYSVKCEKLAKLVGTDSFLWCIPKEIQFEHYEHCKPVEWEISVDDNRRILGFVDDCLWFQYLNEGGLLPINIFSCRQPPSSAYSVLVKFPLLKVEIIRKTVFRVITPTKVDIISEEHF